MTRFRSSWCLCRCTASWPGASRSRSTRSWGSTPPSPWRTSASTGSGKRCNRQSLRHGRQCRMTSSKPEECFKSKTGRFYDDFMTLNKIPTEGRLMCSPFLTFLLHDHTLECFSSTFFCLKQLTREIIPMRFGSILLQRQETLKLAVKSAQKNILGFSAGF